MLHSYILSMRPTGSNLHHTLMARFSFMCTMQSNAGLGDAKSDSATQASRLSAREAYSVGRRHDAAIAFAMFTTALYMC